MVLVVLILVTRRARRHGGALRPGVVGAMYEWQTKDKQRALDVIVQGKAERVVPSTPMGACPTQTLRRMRRPRVEGRPNKDHLYREGR